MARVAAVDLGASSGRVMVADVAPDRLRLSEVHRFGNAAVRLGARLHWDVLGSYRGVLDGLALAAGPGGRLDAVGIDSWGVDYGLLDSGGELLGNPVSYRDARTDGVPEQVNELVAPGELYRGTGVQVLPLNTIYQLVAARGTAQLAAARQLLQIPDLLGYWLSGARVAELTNASTTGLLDVRARQWAAPLMRQVGIEPELFAPLVEPGSRTGELSAEVLAETGLRGPVPLVAVGSHDTASAVVGVPASGERFAYIASGTWSLVGIELDEPVLTEESRAANFANELGVDGTVRYLRNVMGLWLLQECLRDWGEPKLEPLLRAAADEPGLVALFDAGDTRFLVPGRMPARIAAACGRAAPLSRAATVRGIMDSLALAHRRVLRQAVALSGRRVEVVHVVGGGAQNALLCQLTADACGLPVVAGPVEAAAYGNALVQGRAIGVLHGGLAELRGLLAAMIEPRRYEPRDGADWDAAERQVFSRARP